MSLGTKLGTLCLLIVSLSCMNKRKEQSKPTETFSDSLNSTIPINSKNKSSAVFFRATGTEPFWSLEIFEEQIKLKTLTDSIVAPYEKPLQAIKSGDKTYEIQTESSQLNFQIIALECSNQMSGKISPYTVSAEYKKNAEKAFHHIQGCGNYITD